MKFTNLKRIILEDYPAEQRESWGRWGSTWNSFIDQFSQLVNNGIDFNNLNQEIKSVTFTTGSNGQPLGGLTIKTTLKSNINGLIVASIKPANPQTIVTQAPFLNYSQNEQLITISNISGLANETKYTMTILII